ncbi:hypothetical protein JEM51_06740 [Ligilactobacillus agilis]|uniref:hypothetical protein n=1 Tax=Ligilactobacillus agilis TaxID=1601 RepID=UPI00191ED9AC|nr:hypothetical protein [Ligilactobacillus agilis]MBL1056119.1 hypothetical protein [Ligilactobacillus agilis]
MDIKKLKRLIVSSKARKAYQNEKLYDELAELCQMSDSQLLVEKSKLEASQSVLVISVVVILFTVILSAFVTTLVHCTEKYLLLKQAGFKYPVNEIIALKVYFYLVIVVLLVILLALLVVLALAIRNQRNKRILLSLYEFEENRRKRG